MKSLCENERVVMLVLISLIEYAAAECLPLVPRNDFYYIACGFFNLSTLLILTGMRATDLVVDLAKLTFIQLCLQGIGWILYSLYASPHFYNASVHVIVAITYIRILIIGEQDGYIAGHFHRGFFTRHAF